MFKNIIVLSSVILCLSVEGMKNPKESPQDLADRFVSQVTDKGINNTAIAKVVNEYHFLSYWIGKCEPITSVEYSVALAKALLKKIEQIEKPNDPHFKKIKLLLNKASGDKIDSDLIMHDFDCLKINPIALHSIGIW